MLVMQAQQGQQFVHILDKLLLPMVQGQQQLHYSQPMHMLSYIHGLTLNMEIDKQNEEAK